MKKVNSKKKSTFRRTMDDFEARNEREARKKKHIREMKEAERNRISYVRKPFARKSLMAFGLGLVGLAMFLTGLWLAILSQGQSGLNVAAIGFCSIVISGFSFVYGILSFKEKEKNYILSRISVGISGILIFAWVIMIIVGMRG